MKIFHVMQQFDKYGTELLVVDLMNAQVRQGHLVKLLVWNRNMDVETLSMLDPSIEVVNFGRNIDTRNQWHRNIKPLARFNLWLLRHRPDILHIHHISTAKAVRAVAPRRTVMTLHYMASKLEPTGRAGTMVGISRSVVEYINAHCGHEGVLIYDGLSTSGIAVKKDYNPGASFRILQVGRLLCSDKGQDLTLRAIADLKQQGVENISVDFLGDGPDREALQLLARELGIEKQVNWLGWKPREEAMNAYSAYDLCVQPSRHEPFGLTVVEAMAAGVPVVVSDIQGPMEIVDFGRYGAIFTSADAASFARTIANVMQHYPEAAATAAEARTYVNNTFTIEAMERSYMELYRRLLSPS